MKKHTIEAILRDSYMNGDKQVLILGNRALALNVPKKLPHRLNHGHRVVITYSIPLEFSIENDLLTIDVSDKEYRISASSNVGEIGENNFDIIRMSTYITQIEEDKKLQERGGLCIGFAGLFAEVMHIAPFYNCDTPINVAFNDIRGNYITGFYHVESKKASFLKRLSKFWLDFFD